MIPFNIQQLMQNMQSSMKCPAAVRMLGMALILLGGMFSGCDNPAEADKVFTCVEDSATTCWTMENSPYIITDTTVVDSGEVLMIEPGVVVRFEQWVPLIVRGTLIAEGTVKDSIKFLPLGKSVSGNWLYWGGVTLDSCSDNSTIAYSQIKHCLEPLLEILNCSPSIAHSHFEGILPEAESGGSLISCQGTSFPTIKRTTLIPLGTYRSKAIFCWKGANPLIYHNDIYSFVHHAQIAVVGGGFLDDNYLAGLIWEDDGYVSVPDLSFGEPVDPKGDGVFNTTSTDSLQLFIDVDGVINPRSTPNQPMPE